MANRLSKEKAGLIASNYCTNGYKKVEALLSSGYSKSYSENVGLKLFDNDQVKTAIDRIQARNTASTDYSIEQYRQELDQARIHARALNQPSAEVSAIVAKGRSCGYDKSNDIGGQDQQQELDKSAEEKARELIRITRQA